LEVRGVGIVGVKPVTEAELVLVVDLVDAGLVERLPPIGLTARLAGTDLPLVRLTPFEASAPIKLALELARASRK
jgi:HPr kinase/phosphorylase